MKVPLSITRLSNLEINLISKSLRSGWLTHGKNNKTFEKNFSKYIGSKFSISMNSCTSALECSVKLLKKKGEIIIPSWTWVSTANAVLNNECTPVFADVDINTRGLTAKEVEKKITKKTVAVIVVHFGGLPCEIDEIAKLCKKNKLKLIEDSAETLGSKYNNKYTGSFGVGCFSFFPTKNITTTEGGMFTTNNKKEYEYVKKLIAHGIKKNHAKAWHREAVLPGHNFRMPNHLAALGNHQLKQLNKFNKIRNNIAKRYNHFFSQYPKYFEIQKIPSNSSHSYQMYTLIVKQNLRDKFLNFMIKNNIEASIHFEPPLHKQNYLLKFNKGKLPNTEKLSKEIITLPMSQNLNQNQVNYILKKSKEWISTIK